MSVLQLTYAAVTKKISFYDIEVVVRMNETNRLINNQISFIGSKTVPAKVVKNTANAVFFI